jgi:hypothetical protein
LYLNIGWTAKKERKKERKRERERERIELEIARSL